MSDRVKELGEEARKLPFAERAALADEIVTSLYPTDPEIDALWIAEAERRFALVDSGEMQTRDAKEVIAELRQKLKH